MCRRRGRRRADGVNLLKVLPGKIAASEQQSQGQKYGVEEASNPGRDEDQRVADRRGPLSRDDVLRGGRGLQFEHCVFNNGVRVAHGLNAD